MTAMTDTPYHHGNLRQALIEAALATLRRDGIEAVSLRGLARDLGVSHAAPSRHFASRDALFAAIAEQGFAALTERIAVVRDQTDDPVERMHLMARAHLDWASNNPALYAAMRNPDVLRHADPALKARIQAFAQTQFSFVIAARATGWRQDEAPETTLLSIVSGLAGLAMLLTDPFYAEVSRAFTPGDRVEVLVSRLLAP
jgi:AcrR family transcriptional regulator